MNIKILQWNVWYREKVENVIALIQEVDADILCLQELTVGVSSNGGHDVPSAISEATGLECNFAIAHEFKDGHVQGNGIFSKFPIAKNSNFFIAKPQGGSDYSSEGRACAVSKVDPGGKKDITIATTHCSYSHKFADSPAKTDEIRKLTEFFASNEERLVFTGDLNLHPDTQGIRMIEGQLDHCGPGYEEPTWTTKPFSYQGFEETQLGWRLDYAFATKDVKIISSKVIETAYSDHLPILLEVEV